MAHTESREGVGKKSPLCPLCLCGVICLDLGNTKVDSGFVNASEPAAGGESERRPVVQ